jgi:transaldolase
LFISRWDKAAAEKVGDDLRNKLGIAVGQRAYRSYRELVNSPRMLRAMNHGAQVQRLLWASTGTKDPNASDILYIRDLVAPYTVNTMPEKTLHMFAEHGEVGDALSIDGGDSDQIIEAFGKAGVDYQQLAAKLQKDGAESFVKSWNELLETLQKKGNAA